MTTPPWLVQWPDRAAMKLRLIASSMENSSRYMPTDDLNGSLQCYSNPTPSYRVAEGCQNSFVCSNHCLQPHNKPTISTQNEVNFSVTFVVIDDEIDAYILAQIIFDHVFIVRFETGECFGEADLLQYHQLV